MYRYNFSEKFTRARFRSFWSQKNLATNFSTETEYHYEKQEYFLLPPQNINFKLFCRKSVEKFFTWTKMQWVMKACIFIEIMQNLTNLGAYDDF